jgi:uncharacterized protein YfaS (alpha-2-macroglobulin family)
MIRGIGKPALSWLREPRVIVVAAVALLSLVAFVLTRDTGPVPPDIDTQGFAVFPSGTDVPRLTPIKVTFARAPEERDGAQLISLQPPAEGEYTWLTDRTLAFQPGFPGLLRGFRYEVRVAARPEAGLDAPFAAEFTTEGVLKVEHVIPAPADVEVPHNAQVLVQFSRSVAPLTLLSEQDAAPVIVFEPPLPGKGEWLNTSLYRYIPDVVAPNTSYAAVIPAGLTAVADGVLKEDYTWSFTSYGPALDSVTPDNNTQYAAPQQQVTLKFNQPMDTASVEAGFRLSDRDGAAVPGRFTWSDANASAVFTPAARLAPLGTYQVLVPAGLKGVGAGTTKSEWKSTFVTVGPAAIRTTQPLDGATGAGRYGIQLEFTNPMDIDSLEGKVSISGIPQDEIQQGSYGGEMSLGIGVMLEPSTPYTVTIAAGAVDRYGQPLPASSFSFTTGALEPSVSWAVPGSMVTFSASTEPMLYYHATNTATASFALYPLTADEAASLRASNGNTHPEWSPKSPPLRTWSEQIAPARDEVMLKSTSLSGGGPLPKGDYWLTGSGRFTQRMAFSVADTALITKVSNDEILVWALDHDTGRPLSGVAVQGSGWGLTSDRAVTDGNGLASFRVPNIRASTPADMDKRQSWTFLVDEGGHRGVASTLWQQGTSPWQLNLPIEPWPRKYVGHLYTDRPIYRPGEEVGFKGVIREDDDAAYSIPISMPAMDVVIMDPTSKELSRTSIQLNEFGTFAGSLTLPSTASIGEYSISIAPSSIGQLAMGYGGVGGSGFTVAEFRKPEFQVALETGKQTYANGDSVDATATASYFFGGGLPGVSGEWSVISAPESLRVPGFERYSFSMYDYWERAVSREVIRASGSVTTTTDGTAAFSVPATITGNEGAQKYTISVNLVDQNAQAVATSTTVSVYPGEVIAGVKPAEYLGQAGQESRVDLVTVDTAGELLPGVPVTVKVYERRWVTTKEQSAEGARRYRSEPVDTLVATLAATTNDSAEASVSFTPAKGGTLRLVAEATDSRGRVSRSAAYLWVSSREFASWQVTNDDTLQLVADKDRYQVGETAEVLVPAPFQGAIGLVTVERGKIISRSVQQFPTNSERIRIPIVDHSVPNVFVSVALYRPPTAEDPVPRYKVGYVQLPVSTDTRVLDVSIQPDRQQAKPGDTVRYTIRVTDSAGRGVRSELSVAVVDKAVLSLADERGPDGLLAFWFERGLGVMTSSSLSVSVNRANDVITEPQRGGKGGGGLEDERLRQDFRNTAFWQAQLTTADDGTATVDVTMPDNLTTWRLQARAVSGNVMVGEGTNELLSTQPLLLRPALPRFLRVGDSATIRLLVRNATQSASDVQVSLRAEGVEVDGETARAGSVAAGTSTMFEWPARVTTEGTAKFTFGVTGSGGLRDGVVQQLPVALDVTPETTATGGVVKGQAQYEALYLPNYAILENGSLTVSVQPSLTGSLRGELAQFEPVHFPESLDHVVSRVIATAGVRRADASTGNGNGGNGGSASDGRTRTDIATIVGRQNPDGGFSWCLRLTCQSDPWITAWALIALGEAQADGYSVDLGVGHRAQAYLLQHVNRIEDVKNPTDPNQKAFYLYALARAGLPEANLSTMRALQEQYRAQLRNSGRAFLLMGMAEAGVPKENSQAGQLLNDLATGVIASANGNHWEDAPGAEFSNDATRTTSFVLEALVRSDPGHPLIEETVRWLMVARGAGPWWSAMDRAQSILALSEFAASTGELAGDFDYQVSAGENALLDGRFRPGDGAKSDSTKVELGALGKGKVTLLSFLRDFSRLGRMYYTLDLRYVTPAREIEALNRGMAVSHEYSLLGEPGTRVDRVKVGDVVRVKVTVMTPATRNYVLVDDLLPAGLEPIDPTLKTTDPALAAQLENERVQLNLPEGLDYFAPWCRWYYSPWQQIDTRDDRVTLHATRLPKGVHEYVYFARATSVGDYFVAPAHAEESFFPEVFGRSDSSRFVVEP